MDWAIRGGFVSRGTLLAEAGGRALAAAQRWSAPALCFADDGAGGDGGGGGGAADAGGDGGAGAGGGGEGGGGEGAGAGGDADWLEQFSAEGGGADDPSPRDWVKAKGFKSIDDLAKGYREAEKTIRNGKGLAIPGDDAKPEEIAAWREAIGVPKDVEGYAFEVPEGAELDGDVVTPLRDVALAAGVPAKDFKALAEGLVKVQMDQLEAMKTAEDADAAEVLKGWGGQKDAKMAAVNGAMRALELTPADVAAMQRGFSLQGKPGSGKVLNLLARLGDGMAEDALLGGDGKRRFGITGPEAQKEIDTLIADRDFQTKIAAKDPAAVQRWERLNQAVAAHRDQEERRAAAG